MTFASIPFEIESSPTTLSPRLDIEEEPDATRGRIGHRSSPGCPIHEAREARGLSLKAVEIASEGSIRASMLGAYERGKHSITARRLCRLARLYGVPSRSWWNRSTINELRSSGGVRADEGIRLR